MAEVKAPLFGFKASGKLAKALVYFDWKGINVVRSYVIPANPKTGAQQTQRGHMTAGNYLWHEIETPFIALDLSMWNFWAGIQSKPMSGFNAFVQMVIKALLGAESVFKIYNATISGVVDDAFVLTVAHGSTADVELKYGTTPTALINTQARDEAAVAGVESTFTLAGLTASTIYYYQVRGKGAIPLSYSGEYYQKTAAA